MIYETIASEVIDQFPPAVFKGTIHEVKSPKELKKALDYLEQVSILGFDTETKPCFVSHEVRRYKTALLQLASQEKAFLFRLPWCGVSSRLIALLSNPQVLKVGVAIKDDIRGLQAYRAFCAAGFIDLQTMLEPWGIKEKSLKKLTAIVLNLRLSKGQQLSNWENLKLTSAQRHYAALDAWICREIYLALKR